jgi:predicted Fe-Mo cluster-binding NifX family protein
MKVAIPLFENRVSPHFFTAPELLLVQIDGVDICSSWKIPLENLSPSRRKAKILALGLATLLCGGIDGETRRWFERQGVLVKDNQMGNAMEILDRHLNPTNT